MEKNIDNKINNKWWYKAKLLLTIGLALFWLLNSNDVYSQKTHEEKVRKIHRKVAKEHRKPTLKEDKILFSFAYPEREKKEKKHKRKKKYKNTSK